MEQMQIDPYALPQAGNYQVPNRSVSDELPSADATSSVADGSRRQADLDALTDEPFEMFSTLLRDTSFYFSGSLHLTDLATQVAPCVHPITVIADSALQTLSTTVINISIDNVGCRCWHAYDAPLSSTVRQGLNYSSERNNKQTSTFPASSIPLSVPVSDVAAVEPQSNTFSVNRATSSYDASQSTPHAALSTVTASQLSQQLDSDEANARIASSSRPNDRARWLVNESEYSEACVSRRNRFTALGNTNFWPPVVQVRADVCETEPNSSLQDIDSLEVEECMLLRHFEAHAVRNLNEHQWMHCNSHTIEYTQYTPEFATRIEQLLRCSFRYPLFVFAQTREMTFCRYLASPREQSNQLQSNDDSFYIEECLQSSGLELGNDAWLADKPEPSRLASAGFIATLSSDEVHCFACGLCLSQWKPADDSWVKHAYMSPECAHVLARRGAAFVRQVCNRYDGFFPSVVRRLEPREFRARPELPLLRAVIEECALQTPAFAEAIETQMLRTGKDFANLVELVEAVQDLQTRSVSDEREFVRLCNIEADLLARGAHPSQTTARSTSQREGESLSGAPRNSRDEDDVHRTACNVCLDQPLEVAFVPCGHLATCHDCAARLSDCPVCRTPIRGTLRVRL